MHGACYGLHRLKNIDMCVFSFSVKFLTFVADSGKINVNFFVKIFFVLTKGPPFGFSMICLASFGELHTV